MSSGACGSGGAQLFADLVLWCERQDVVGVCDLVAANLLPSILSINWFPHT